MTIDWSKAPEGATHYCKEDDDNLEHWLKVEGNCRWVFNENRSAEWVPDEERDDPPLSAYIARPAPWSGEGLPPVGTVCEALLTFDKPDEQVWRKVEVAFLHPHSGLALVFDVVTFRPSWADELCLIRTPEQIAAEERESCIKQMMNDVRNSCDIFGDLYDLGYRKVEGGDA